MRAPRTSGAGMAAHFFLGRPRADDVLGSSYGAVLLARGPGPLLTRRPEAIYPEAVERDLID